MRLPRTGLIKMISNVNFRLERNVLNLVYVQVTFSKIYISPTKRFEYVWFLPITFKKLVVEYSPSVIVRRSIDGLELINLERQSKIIMRE